MQKLFGILLGLVFALTWSARGLAYVNKGTVQTMRIHKTLNSARSAGIQPSWGEKKIKRELTKLKKINPRQFDELLADEISHSPDYLSYIYEVRDDLKKVEKAKTIAQYQLREALKKNWSDIQNTTINTSAATKWKAFDSSLLEKLQKMKYRSKNKKNEYVFALEDWGLVKVSPSLKTTQWFVEVNSDFDGNELQAGVEKITTKETP